jgi:hypothetical protein
MGRHIGREGWMTFKTSSTPIVLLLVCVVAGSPAHVIYKCVLVHDSRLGFENRHRQIWDLWKFQFISNLPKFLNSQIRATKPPFFQLVLSLLQTWVSTIILLRRALRENSYLEVTLCPWSSLLIKKRNN